jgi:O-methyltransferase involved in polyketide biosynthesis
LRERFCRAVGRRGGGWRAPICHRRRRLRQLRPARARLCRGDRIFEIDHPATQDLKLNQLRAAVVADPPGVHFIAADFARKTLGSVLARSGLDPSALVFFS